jgi:asparagine synthase (glutamine-hydrolysing)
MQSQSSRPVATFTIGFEEAAYSEASDAAAVARHLGTDHTELLLSADDALALIPDLASIWCEPFGDASQIPTLLVSQLARKDVTVAISGDGGDEIFGGYNRHISGPAIWRRLEQVPGGVRNLAAKVLSGPRQESWDKLYRLVEPLLPARYRISMPGFKAHKLAGVMLQPDFPALYSGLVSHWQDPSSIVLGSSETRSAPDHQLDLPTNTDLEHWTMALDTLTYLPNDILTKVDRAAMSTSLETRIPFLDHRIVEYAWTLPLEMKIEGGQGKRVLREVLYRYVPKSLVERPKAGFEIPIAEWLRGSLRHWAEELLDEHRIRREGVLDPAPIREMWAEHLSGSKNWQNQLWDVLMFQEWYFSQV